MAEKDAEMKTLRQNRDSLNDHLEKQKESNESLVYLQREKEEMINVISAYALQVVCKLEEKELWSLD